MYKTVCCRDPTMESVKRTVTLVLNLPHGGGRLLARDDYTLVLMDYDYLPHRAIQLIVDQHPHLQIDTHQSDHSTTGYVVIFTLPPSQNIFLTSVCLQMLLTILFVVVVGTLPSLNCWRILL